MPKIAFLFPGQGAQAVGMCRELDQELPAVRELFDRAGEILGHRPAAPSASRARPRRSRRPT